MPQKVDFQPITEIKVVGVVGARAVKWLLFLFSGLGAVLRSAALFCFFAVAALLEPANVPQATERQGHKLHKWVLEGCSDLLCVSGLNMIGKSGPSQTV